MALTEETREAFTRDYGSFFSSVHYSGHPDLEQGIAQRMREQFHLFEEPLTPHPVEAIGATKDFDALMGEASTKTPDEMMEEFERAFRESFITKAFFYYALAKTLKEGKSLTEIADDAYKDFHMVGRYTIGKLHEPREEKNPLLILDWHDLLKVDQGIRDNMLDFLRYYKDKGFSLIIASAALTLYEELARHKDLVEIIDAVYEVPGIGPPFEVCIGGRMRMDHWRYGKVYTDILKKLEVDNRYALLLTNAALDRSVENTYPIYSLVITPDTPIIPIRPFIDHLVEVGSGDINQGGDDVKTRAIHWYNNGVSKYNIRGVTVYRHPNMDDEFLIGDEVEISKEFHKLGLGHLDGVRIESEIKRAYERLEKVEASFREGSSPKELIGLYGELIKVHDVLVVTFDENDERLDALTRRIEARLQPIIQREIRENLTTKIISHDQPLESLSQTYQQTIGILREHYQAFHRQAN